MSATQTDAIVEGLLLARVLEMATQGPRLPVSVPEDKTFTRPGNGKYIEAINLRNAPAWSGLAGGKVRQGIFSLILHWPRGAGTIHSMNAAGLVADHFPVGTDMETNGVRVSIYQEPDIGSEIPGTTDLQLVISVSYRVYLAS
jgi:hypothetical protein